MYSTIELTYQYYSNELFDFSMFIILNNNNNVFCLHLRKIDSYVYKSIKIKLKMKEKQCMAIYAKFSRSGGQTPHIHAFSLKQYNEYLNI